MRLHEYTINIVVFYYQLEASKKSRSNNFRAALRR
jgi:hypothetical protein